jgi:hypothetical protein
MEIKIIVPLNEVVMVNEEGVPLHVPPLTDGETLVDVGTYNDYVKPFYNGSEWVESATEEEIAIARPTPKHTLSETDKLWDAVTYLLGVK